MSIAKERPVIITTAHYGVFFGYAADTSGASITLTRARNCIYWSAKTGGVLGLASTGPGAGSRIGARVDQVSVRNVTTVIEVTPVAAKSWEAAGVYKT